MRANSDHQLLDTPVRDVESGPVPPAGTARGVARYCPAQPGSAWTLHAGCGRCRSAAARSGRAPGGDPARPGARRGPAFPRWGSTPRARRDEVRRERRARPGGGEGRRPDPSMSRGRSAAAPGLVPTVPARTCPAAPPLGPPRSRSRVPPWGPAARSSAPATFPSAPRGPVAAAPFSAKARRDSPAVANRSSPLRSPPTAGARRPRPEREQREQLRAR